MTSLDIITAALQELNVYASSEQLSIDDANFGLGKLNDLTDQWSARRVYIYTVTYPTFTLVSGLLPHTIGPTGATFTTPNAGPRPQRVEQANLILTDQTPNVELEMNIRDSDWWMNQRVKSLETNVPTDLHYEPTWPNGSLYFWPVPNYAYGVRLKLWGILPQFAALNTAFTLPPGYQKAVKLSLARDCADAFAAKWSPAQEMKWREAMKAVEANNIQSPRGTTADAGMPGVRMRGDFNYYTGMPN